MKEWQLQDAKARFSEVVRMARKDGPQRITVHGKSEVIVISEREYNKLIRPKSSFITFMRSSPLLGVKLNIKHDTSPMRDIDL